MYLSPFSVAAHDFHASFTLLERNPAANSLEVTLRVFADDLERALSEAAGKAISLDRTQEIDTLVFDYIRRSFELRSSDGAPATFTWIGKELRVDTVWIYIETSAPRPLAGTQVRSRLLFDQFDDQVNLVQTKDGSDRRTLTFRRGDDFRAIGTP